MGSFCWLDLVDLFMFDLVSNIRLVGWLVSWLVAGRLDAWLPGRLADWVGGWLFARLANTIPILNRRGIHCIKHYPRVAKGGGVY